LGATKKVTTPNATNRRREGQGSAGLALMSYVGLDVDKDKAALSWVKS